jgi:hypothetical protein
MAQRCKITLSLGRCSLETPASSSRCQCMPMGPTFVLRLEHPQDELDSCNHIHLTSDREWEPYNIKFPEIAVVHRDTHTVRRDIEEDFVPGEIYNIDGFRRRLIASCRINNSQIASVVRDVHAPPTFQTEERRADVTPEQLADRWLLGIETAKQTLRNTTQRFIRSALLPLSRRYKADRMYQIPRL